MWNYLFQNIVNVLTPYMGASFAVLSGIIVSNMFWKNRIFRYAKAEVIQIMEFQENKIAQLEEKLRIQKEINSELRAFEKRAKLNAMKIMEGK